MQEQAVQVDTGLSIGCKRVLCSIPSARKPAAPLIVSPEDSRWPWLLQNMHMSTSSTCCYALLGAAGGGAVFGCQLCLKVDAEQDLQVRSTISSAQPAQLALVQLHPRTTACLP